MKETPAFLKWALMSINCRILRLPVFVLSVIFAMLGCLFYPVIHVLLVILYFNGLVQTEKKHGEVNYFPIICIFIVYLVYVVPVTLFFWCIVPTSILIYSARICIAYLTGRYHKTAKQEHVYRIASLVVQLFEYLDWSNDALVHRAHSAFNSFHSSSSFSSTDPTSKPKATPVAIRVDAPQISSTMQSKSLLFTRWTLSKYMERAQTQRKHQRDTTHSHSYRKFPKHPNSSSSSSSSSSSRAAKSSMPSSMRRASAFLSTQTQPARTFASEVFELICQILLVPLYCSILSFLYDFLYCLSNDTFLDVLALDLRKNL